MRSTNRTPRTMALYVIAGLAAIAGAARAADDKVVKTYPLGLTDPAAAAELVRGMLSPDGRVVEDAPNHRIVVLDRPAVQARVAEALARACGRRSRSSGATWAPAVVREGEEIDLGGLPMSNQEFQERFLLGVGRSGQTERVQIRLKARVEPSPP